jgi:hypothetical protein
MGCGTLIRQLKDIKSEFTLVPRQPVPKLKLLNVRDVLNIVRYLQNPQNTTLFEALAHDSVNIAAEDDNRNQE